MTWPLFDDFAARKWGKVRCPFCRSQQPWSPFWLAVLVEMIKLVRSYSSSCHRNRRWNLQEHQEVFLGKPHTALDVSGIREKTLNISANPPVLSHVGQAQQETIPMVLLFRASCLVYTSEESSKRKISGKCMNGHYANIANQGRS